MHRTRSAASAAAAVLIPAAGLIAAPVSFAVDPVQSSLTVGGSFNSIPATAQSPGSDTARVAGTIVADLTDTAITFAGGSAIDALPQPLPQQPAPGGVAGAAPADFGLQFDLGLLGTALAAGRDFVFDLSGGPLALSGGGFSLSGLNVEVDSGTLDFNTNLGSGSENFIGETAPVGPGSATLSRTGLVETLTIPVEATLTFTAINTNDSTVTLTGQVVATRLIPEPATAGLVLGGVLTLAARRRRA